MRYFLRVTRSSILATIFTFFYVQASAGMPTPLRPEISNNQLIDGQKATLRDLLIQLKDKYKVNILFEDGLVNQPANRVLPAGNVTLEQSLTRILQPHKLYFKKVSEGVYVITREKETKSRPTMIKIDSLVGKEAFPGLPDKSKEVRVIPQLESLNPAAPSADTPVRGKVSDEKGEPLPGVNILLKGTTRGLTTDTDGYFSIDVPNGEAVLVFSFVGYLSQEVVVGNRTNFEVAMQVDEKSLEEVVVVGYGTQKKGDVTGSVTTVYGDELIKMPVGSTVNSLVGKVPGLVTAQSSGEPGRDNASLNIRGFGTPLIIVDGVQRPLSEFNAIDPNSIESVSVLKDASAAIYGARSGNGVVLVTTKRGNSGKPVFQLNSSLSLQQTTSSLKPLNSYQFATLQNEAAFNDRSPLPWTEEQIELFRNGTNPQYPNTDWFDIALREFAPQYQHNLSMRGGNDRIRYFGSIGVLGQEYFYKTGDSKYDRYNLRSNIDADVTKNLTASIDISYLRGDITSPQQGSEQFFETLFSYPSIFPAFYPDKTKLPQVVPGESPWTNINLDIGGYNREITTNTNLSGSLNYKIPFIEGLSAKIFGNYRETVYRSKSWDKQFDTYTYDWDNDIYTLSTGSSPTTLNQSSLFTRAITTQLSLNYDHSFGKHNVSALALYENIDNASENIAGSKRNYLTNSIDYLFAGGTENQTITGVASQTGWISYVGRINYDYSKKYLLQFAIRADASPIFPKNSRWGYFPSVSAGWNITEEGFMNSVRTLDNLKLRVSYSNTGYDNTGNFQYLTGFRLRTGFDPSYLMGGVPIPGLVTTGLANESITWENMNTYNLGLDYSLWGGKLFGEVDIFYRNREGMLATRAGALPSTFGATLPAENINSQNNRGFEFKLGTKGTRGDFNYSIEGYISWNRAKWDHREEPDYNDSDDIRINKRSGNWVNRTFGYKDAGLFTSQEEINNYPVDIDGQGNATIRPGYVKWIDQNGDGILTWRDQVLIGHGAIPEMYAGLTTNLRYKNFDLSILFQGAARNIVQLSADRVLSITSGASIAFDPDRWTVENNKSDARFPASSASANSNTKPNSERWTENGSYLRLKNLQLGYALPRKLINRVGINDLRINLTGTNLLTFSKLNEWNYDPEYPATDFRDREFRGFYYPVQRLYTLGVSVSF